ncbi:MAG TPA: GMC family oxidoreductase [Polyangia bacterium]|jgi:cholesterol oxidase|nr:GMC family oxidoreductase [Polyangia bacterium]
MRKPRVIVIGSGFGGSVFAARLAETGRYEVHVFERGREYGRNQFPRRPDELNDAVWDPATGRLGLYEWRSSSQSEIDVLTASGVGGGSLIYSNVLYPMPAEFFRGWPGGLHRELLDPYYERVFAMLEAHPYPATDPRSPYARTPKTQALLRVARELSQDAAGHAAVELEWPRLAVQFGGPPGEELHNEQGAVQSHCIMCGECNFGCNYRSKTTVDITYLQRARRFGAVVEPWHEVRSVIPRPGPRPDDTDGGYLVGWVDPRHPRAAPQFMSCEHVVLAAGSLGSPRLLLRMKEQHHLPRLSPALGTRWSPNGDLLGFVVHAREALHSNQGPVITGSLRFHNGAYRDGTPHGLYVQDAGFPLFLLWYLTALAPSTTSRWESLLGALHYLRGVIGWGRARHDVQASAVSSLPQFLFRDQPSFAHALGLLGMGRDLATGRLHLQPSPGGLPDDVQVDWHSGDSELHYERLRDAMRRIAQALGGELIENPLSLFRRYISVHPVGGCPIGDDPDHGVVDAHTGEVFGYPGLYVADGSIMPTAIGPNPSLTIAGMAELYAERFIHAHLGRASERWPRPAPSLEEAFP